MICIVAILVRKHISTNLTFLGTSRRVAQKVSQKPFNAQNVKKVFLYKSRLASHSKLHAKEKQQTCEVCNQIFRRKDLLEKHRLVCSTLIPSFVDFNISEEPFHEDNNDERIRWNG